VQTFRTLIRQRQEEERRDAESMGKDAAISHPALIIGKALRSEAAIDIGKAFDKHDEQKSDFYQPISFAWNAIAFEHLRYRYRGEEYINSLQGFFAADGLSHHYQRSLAMGESRPDIINLDPQQVKILDALAEAADVPHQRGQAEIEIPENLRYYRRYRFSPAGKLI
jgi:hypothetical protein